MVEGRPLPWRSAPGLSERPGRRGAGPWPPRAAGQYYSLDGNELRRFTIEDLKGFNGQNGSPIYVAYGGRVIDVTESRYWRGGMHMQLHAAGSDLSSEMSRAPHDPSVLDRYPQVGVLISAGADGGPGAGRPPGGPRSILTEASFFPASSPSDDRPLPHRLHDFRSPVHHPLPLHGVCGVRDHGGQLPCRRAAFLSRCHPDWIPELVAELRGPSHGVP